jgi:hypothetical protein
VTTHFATIKRSKIIAGQTVKLARIAPFFGHPRTRKAFMKFFLSLLPGVLAALMLCDAQAAPDLTAQQAKTALSAQAAAKMRDTGLLDAQQVDVLVEYHTPGELLTTGDLNVQQQAKVLYADVKQRVMSRFKVQDVEQLRDFDAVPMNFVRINNRRALLQLLNDSSVKAVYKAVYENKVNHPASQPLIR